jgi:hypothetical protein
MKFAYADPPYIGQAQRHYSEDPNCAEVDHKELIDRMCRDYDAWVLSLSSPTLKYILSLCPDNVRVCSWVKPFSSYKPGINPAYSWEPIITFGNRPRGRQLPTINDWVSANITLKRGVHGAKPDKFCYWLFEFMGLLPGDELIDLYPGSGAVSRAWENWNKRMSTHNLAMFDLLL